LNVANDGNIQEIVDSMVEGVDVATTYNSQPYEENMRMLK
jgi:hypothetical protein